MIDKIKEYIKNTKLEERFEQLFEEIKEANIQIKKIFLTLSEILYINDNRGIIKNQDLLQNIIIFCNGFNGNKNTRSLDDVIVIVYANNMYMIDFLFKK